MDLAKTMTLLGFGPTGWGGPLLRAALMTLVLSAAGFALGSAIGAAMAAARLARSRVLRAISDAYGTVFRGVPDLLTIYLLYFGGSVGLTAVYHALGGTGFLGLPAFATGMAAVGVISGAYQSEVFRGAYQAIDRGQLQAADAYGMGRVLKFRRIVVPQVLRYALPSLGNVWQLVLKDSALVSVVGVVELMRQSQIAAGSTREPFTFYVGAAVLYLIITFVTGALFRRAEGWAMRGVRSG